MIPAATFARDLGRLTPEEAARALAHWPNLLWIDSAENHPERGRYSYVSACPYDWRDRTEVIGPGEVAPFVRRDVQPEDDSDPESLAEIPPFRGGYAVLLSYEANRLVESRAPSPRANEFAFPRAVVVEYPWVLAFDHVRNRCWFVQDLLREPVGEGGSTFGRVCAALERLPWNPRPVPVNRITADELVPQFPVPGFPGVSSNFSPGGFRDAVRRAVDYTHAGDVFQVNLAQRLLAPLAEHPFDLYRRLRRLNPAPFAAYWDLGDFQIASASPERFLQVSANGDVSTKPIKGTRRRGGNPMEDAALVADLTGSAKDRAENVMIVDLLRNDLGRVCEYGSIRVPKVCEVESYRFVHHLVSEVRGKLRPGLTAWDLLKAAFPGGSITGAPKVRAMEVIAELEPTARGPYCGTLGLVGYNGFMDSSILIRTFTAGRGWLQFPAGGGVVADSVPAREYEETLAKAAGLLRALPPPAPAAPGVFS